MGNERKQYIYMISQAEAVAEEKPCFSSNTAPRTNVLPSLNNQIKHLRKVINLKDQALEEITSLLQHTPNKMSPLASRQHENVSRTPYQSRIHSSLERDSEAPNQSRGSNLTIDNQDGMNERNFLGRLREDIEGIIKRHSAAIEVLNAHRTQKSEPQSYFSLIKQLNVVEVPVQLQLLPDTISQAIQVEIFETPKNSASEVVVYDRILQQSPLPIPSEKQGHDSRSSDLAKDDYLPDIEREVQVLRAEIIRLKQELTHDRPFSFEIEINAQSFSVPQDQQTIEVPIELVVQNDPAYSVTMEMREEQPFASQDSKEQETRPNITSQQSLPKGKHNLLTQSHISQQSHTPHQKEASIMVEEECSRIRSAADSGESRIALEAPADDVIPYETPVGVVSCVQVPVQLYITQEIIKYVEVVKEVVKYIEVPIAKVEEVEVYSIMPVEIPNQSIEVPIIHEIPVEIILVKDQQQDKQIKKEGEEAPLSLKTRSIEQQIQHSPVEFEIEVEVQGLHLLAQQNPTSSPSVQIVQKIVEVQKIVQVQKIVYVPVQVPVEVIRTIEVEKIVQVPVQLIVQVQKIVQYETVIEKINQIVIQKTTETVRDRNIIVQVPVQLKISETTQSLQQTEERLPTLASSNNPLQKQQNHQQIEITEVEIVFDHPLQQKIIEVVKIVQVPVQVIVIKEVPVQILVIKEVPVQVIHTVEVPVELIKTVQVIKQLQVPIEVVREVIRVIEVPVQLQLDPQTRVIEHYVPYIVEVPLEVNTISIKEVPIQMEMEPLIYEIPIDLQTSPNLYEVPVQMQEPPIVIQVPVEMNIIEDVTESPQKSSKKQPIQHILCEQDCASPTLPLALKDHPQNPQHPQDEVVLIPTNQEMRKIEINSLNSPNNEIVVQISIDMQPNQQERPRAQSKEGQSPSNNFAQSDQRLFETLKLMQGQKEQQKTEVRVVEVPIQLEVDSSEDIRRALQLKYRDRINDLHTQYSDEISALHQMLQNMQKIILEAQGEKQQLQEKLQHKALQEEALSSSVSHLEDVLQQKEAAIIAQQEEKTKLIIEYQLASSSLHALQQEHQQLIAHLQQLQNQPPLIYEMAVEMTLVPQNNSAEVQTDQLLLTEAISLIEVPVQMEVVQRITDSALYRSQQQQEEARSSSTTRYFKGYTEDELLEKLRVMAIRGQRTDRGVQTDVSQDNEFDAYMNPINDITEVVESLTLPKKEERFKSFVDFQQSNNHLISGIIESAEDYANQIEDIRIYECVVQVVPEPIIYQVPVDLRLCRELAVSEVQTEDSQNMKKRAVCEVPIQMAVGKETDNACVQTEDIQDMHWDESAVESRHRLFGSNNALESHLIQIPIELNIHLEKDTVSVDVQTQQGKISYQQTAGTTGFPHHNLAINQTVKATHFPASYLPDISRGNPYEMNVIRLDSATESVPEHRLMELASHNHSLTLQQIYDELCSGQKQPMLLTESANIREVILHESGRAQGEVVVEVEEGELHFKEVTQLQEAGSSQLNQNYIDIYDAPTHEVQKYRQEAQQREEENGELRKELQQLQDTHQDRLKELSAANSRLQRIIQEQQQTIQQLREALAEQVIRCQRHERSLEQLQEEYERLKAESTNAANSALRQADRLKTTIAERVGELREVRAQEQQVKEMYQAEIISLRQQIIQREQIIEQLEQDNHRKTAKIIQMAEYHDELRRAVVDAKLSTEGSAAALYQQEFQRIKDHFEEQLRELKEELQASSKEIQQLREELEEEAKRGRTAVEETRELELALAHLRQQHTALLGVKEELQSSYVDSIKEFNAQLLECRELIADKDRVIQQLQSSPQRLFSPNPELEMDSPPIRMEYLSRRVSREAEDPWAISSYVQKLEKLLLRYERMLICSEASIEELQEKVCEYLRDALEKEQEAEALYSKLVEYETAMNAILVEKITLEIENKRMAKAVELSERKVIVMGNKLLEAVGKHDAGEEDSDYRYH